VRCRSLGFPRIGLGWLCKCSEIVGGSFSTMVSSLGGGPGVVSLLVRALGGDSY
jgi:hypothetical protein